MSFIYASPLNSSDESIEIPQIMYHYHRIDVDLTLENQDPITLREAFRSLPKLIREDIIRKYKLALIKNAEQITQDPFKLNIWKTIVLNNPNAFNPTKHDMKHYNDYVDGHDHTGDTSITLTWSFTHQGEDYTLSVEYALHQKAFLAAISVWSLIDWNEFSQPEPADVL